METDDEIKLYINGKVYGGWKSASVKLAMTSIAGSFDLALTESWLSERGGDVPRIKRQDECRLYMGPDKVITGYIDKITPSVTKDDRTLTISGRTKAGDLVDCSCELTESQYLNLPVEVILKRLAGKYGIKVTANVDTGKPYLAAAIQPSESTFEVMSRICKSRGLLVVSDPDGNLIVTNNRKLKTGFKIVDGINMLSGSVDYDDSERHSVVKVLANNFGNEEFAEDATKLAIEASATDKEVKRYRPLIINNENAGDATDAKKRAIWEVATRRAKSIKATATVKGWRKPDGLLWAFNELVEFESAWLGLKAELLVASVNFSVSDDNGKTTTLELVPADSFLPEPKVSDEAGMWKELK